MLGKDHRVYDGTTMGGVTIDYVAAKGGVISMTREMACWLAQYNIRVNCISPGGFWRNHTETVHAAIQLSRADGTHGRGRQGDEGGRRLSGLRGFFLRHRHQSASSMEGCRHGKSLERTERA